MSKLTIRNAYKTITNPILVNKGGEWFITYSYRNEGQGRTYSGRERLGALDRDEARVAFQAWQTTQAQLNDAQAVKVLDEILTPYEDMLKARELKARTYLGNIKFLRTAFGHMPITLMDTKSLNDFGKARGIKAETLRSYIGTLNSAMKFAQEDGKLTLADQRRFKLPAKGQPRTFYLKQAEADELYERAMAEGGEIALLVALAMDTGARRGALNDLTWDRVDLKANTIDFRIPGRVIKNKRRVAVQIFKRLRPVLERAYRERDPRQETVLKPRHVDHFTDWVKSIEWRHKAIAQTHLHALRHTFATLLILERNVPLDRVASLLGDTMATVSQTYAHLRPSSEAFDL